MRRAPLRIPLFFSPPLGKGPVLPRKWPRSSLPPPLFDYSAGLVCVEDGRPRAGLRVLVCAVDCRRKIGFFLACSGRFLDPLSFFRVSFRGDTSSKRLSPLPGRQQPTTFSGAGQSFFFLIDTLQNQPFGGNNDTSPFPSLYGGPLFFLPGKREKPPFFAIWSSMTLFLGRTCLAFSFRYGEFTPVFPLSAREEFCAVP